MLLSGIFDDADAAGVAHPGFVEIEFPLGAEYPAERGAHGGGNLGFVGIAIGIDERAIVFGMLGHEVDEGLKTGAATSGDLNLFGGFEQGLHFAQFYIELHHIYLLDAVFEKAVDGGVEVLEIFIRDARTTVHTDDHARAEIVTAAHGIVAKAAIGAHAGELALLGEDAGAEPCQNLTIVDACLGRGNDLLNQLAWH